MTLRRFLTTLAVGGLCLALVACGPKNAITTSHTPLQLGDVTVDVVVHEAASPGLTYFNLHDDENTSVRAALDVIGEHGGRVIELKHSGDRRISFRLGDSTYEFDPNRMFTDMGRAATLERFGGVNDAALAAVRTFADAVLQKVNPTQLHVIVTLHNTQASYTVYAYTSEGDYANEAELVHTAKEMDPNDFFFVIDRGLYDQLRQMEQNVVLQDNLRVTDDGSLSVWSAQQGVGYVNVEAQHGHRPAQARMLLRLHELLYAEGEAVEP